LALLGRCADKAGLGSTENSMRNGAVGFLLLFGIAVPPFAWADSPPSTQPAVTPRKEASGVQLRTLLNDLDLGLVAKAYAAECKDEGEMCKTNSDCCPGLECSGDPQTTCRPQE
jgi:hypothetical protein